jgi:hypothetical protein
MTKQIQESIIIATVAVATIAMSMSLSYFGGPIIDEAEIAARIEHEDVSLCGKLGFPQGTPRAVECEADLADLRRRHEKIIASRQF